MHERLGASGPGLAAGRAGWPWNGSVLRNTTAPRRDATRLDNAPEREIDVQRSREVQGNPSQAVSLNAEQSGNSAEQIVIPSAEQSENGVEQISNPNNGTFGPRPTRPMACEHGRLTGKVMLPSSP